MYLDNARSIGPNSPAGQRSGGPRRESRARNPRAAYARRAHDLHQEDVTRFANVITGWSADVPPRPAAAPPVRLQCATCTSRPHNVIGREYPDSVSSRAASCCRRRDAIRRPRGTWPRSSRAISWPTIRRSRWWASSPSDSSTRRRSRGVGEHAGGGAEVGGGARQQRPANGGSACCARGQHAARRRADHAGAKPTGRAAVGAVGAQRIRRRMRDPGSTAWRSGIDVASQRRAGSRQDDPKAAPTRRSGRSPRRKRAGDHSRGRRRPQALALLFTPPEFHAGETMS